MIDWIQELIASLVVRGRAREDGDEFAIQTRGGLQVRARRIQTFGIASRLPRPSEVVACAIGGDPSNTIIIADDSAVNIPALEKGDAVIYAGADAGTRIIVRADGGIEIQTQGAVTVTGGDVIADGVSLKTHTHAYTAPAHPAGQQQTAAPTA